MRRKLWHSSLPLPEVRPSITMLCAYSGQVESLEATMAVLDYPLLWMPSAVDPAGEKAGGAVEAAHVTERVRAHTDTSQVGGVASLEFGLFQLRR